MKTKKLNAVTRFFCKSSGAYLPILEKCPSQVTKYFGMGVILWITAIMACFSGGYFITTVFSSGETENSWLGVGFALFWGLAIFFLDRYMVTSITIGEGFKKSILQATPRLLLAVCLGLIVSKPLEMKFFEKEINSEIIALNQSEYKTKLRGDSELEKSNLKLQNLEAEEKKLDSTLLSERTLVNKLQAEYYDELNGLGLSGKSGYGPQAKERRKLWEDAQVKYKTLELDSDQEKKKLKEEKERVARQIDEIRNGIQSPLNTNDGPLKRIEALHNITSQNTTLRIVDFLLSLIFILFEIAPILVKLSMKEGLYETALNSYEKKIEDGFEEMAKYKKHKTIFDFKKKTSGYNGDIIYFEEIKNKKREADKKIDLEVVKEYEKLEMEKLKNANFIKKRIKKINSFILNNK